MQSMSMSHLMVMGSFMMIARCMGFVCFFVMVGSSFMMLCSMLVMVMFHFVSIKTLTAIATFIVILINYRDVTSLNYYRLAATSFIGLSI
jgi:hypothetical protein